MIRFSKFYWLYTLISLLVLAPGLFFLVKFGLKPSIDFTGGTLLEVGYSKDLSKDYIEKQAETTGIVLSSVQKSENNTFIFRLREDDAQKVKTFLEATDKEASASSEIIRQEVVGPVLGRELLVKALAASILAVIAILSYIAYSFKNIKFGISAIAALFHDVLVVFGSFAIFGYFFQVEIDTLFITAVLTTMSFSVHDTIVVFDRIREYQRKAGRMTFEEVSDLALTETLGRSLANSMTIIYMLVALVLLGGETTKWFVTALLIGTISGTYSSDFVATPILVLLTRMEEKKRKK